MKEKYRAVYIPQVPMKGITVETKSLEHAVIALESMVQLSIFEFENRVKPDYSDMAVIERWDAEYGDWENVEEEEWEPLITGLVTVGTTADE